MTTLSNTLSGLRMTAGAAWRGTRALAIDVLLVLAFIACVPFVAAGIVLFALALAIGWWTGAIEREKGQ